MPREIPRTEAGRGKEPERELDSNELEALTGTAGPRFVAGKSFYKATIYNGNEDITVTELTIKVTTKVKKQENSSRLYVVKEKFLRALRKTFTSTFFPVTKVQTIHGTLRKLLVLSFKLDEGAEPQKMPDQLDLITAEQPYFVIKKDGLGELINEVNRAIKNCHCIPLGGVTVIGDKSERQFLQAVMRQN